MTKLLAYTRPTLRRTLLRWLLIPLMSLLVLSSIAAYAIALRLAQDAFDRALYESAYDIAQLVRKSAQEGNATFDLPDATEDLILTDKFDEMFYNIRDREGQLLSGDPDLPSPAGKAPSPARRGEYFYDSIVNGQSVRVASLAITLQLAGVDRIVRIQVAETRHKREQLAKEILSGLIVPQLLLILMAVGIVWFAVGRGLQPLSKLESAVALRSHLDLSPVQAPDAPAEAQPLVSAINALLLRLQDILNAQNRFIADAAHQLRTPLAGLKAQVALASRQQNIKDVRHSLDQLEIGADRLTHLVNQLLSVARNEPGADRSIALVALDLNALAQDTTGEWVSIALKRDIDLGYEGTRNPVWVKGDALRLTEMLKNLLDNALRYTQPGGTVTVRVTDGTTLEVEDNGSGIPEDERERIFERFYRVLGNGADGSGLGLSIVKEIAQTHGASVTYTTGKDGTGSCFRVSFPQESPEHPASP
jgi:two-component system sensor histidine kinase TctE